MVKLIFSDDSITLSLSMFEQICSMGYCSKDLACPLSTITAYKAYKDLSSQARGVQLFGIYIPGMNHMFSAV